jgi:hypothetical protein
MAWGALAGDDAYFREGLVAFDMALADMRADGSLPLETRRGSRALWYQRHAIASLVAIAEMGAVQGRNLYARERDGRSLHTAVRFLLDAIDDAGLVRRYADRGDEDRPRGRRRSRTGRTWASSSAAATAGTTWPGPRSTSRASRGATRADDCCGCCATPSRTSGRCSTTIAAVA